MRGGAWILVLLLAVSTARFATAAIESFGSPSHCGAHRFLPGAVLPLFRGTSLELAVRGFGLDNADRVEAVTLPGVKARLAGRRAFPEPQALVALRIDADAPPGKGEIRLRYAVEVAGYDRILVEVLDPPRIDSLAAGKSELRLGDEVELTATGSDLLDVKPRASFGGAGAFSGVSVVRASATESRVRMRARRIGTFVLDRESFSARVLGCDASPLGAGRLTLAVH